MTSRSQNRSRLERDRSTEFDDYESSHPGQSSSSITYAQYNHSGHQSSSGSSNGHNAGHNTGPMMMGTGHHASTAVTGNHVNVVHPFVRSAQSQQQQTHLRRHPFYRQSSEGLEHGILDSPPEEFVDHSFIGNYHPNFPHSYVSSSSRKNY